MKTIRKLKFLLVLALMGVMPILQAQTRVSWSGNVNGQTISSNTEVILTGDVYLKGSIKVAQWKTLTIRTNGNYTIHRSGFNGWMFCETANNVDNRCNIDIDGGDYTITIDGGAVYNTPNDATSGFTTTPSNSGRAIWCNGHLTMNNVTVQNFYHPNETGFIDLENKSTTSSYNCVITNCTIQGCYGGSAFFMEGSDYHRTTLQNVTFQYNEVTHGVDPWGACVRTNGATRSSLKMKDCKFFHNITEGGAIHWNAGGRTDSRCDIYGDTEIAYNTSINNNGGIYNCAIMNISSAYIHDNYATNEGGGIRMSPYSGGMSQYLGEGYNLTITDSVRVCNNSAGKFGGGIFLTYESSPDVAYDPDGNAVTAHFNLDIEGGEINGNHAPNGGGIYIVDGAPYIARFNNKDSGPYVRNIRIKPGAKIFGNYTDSGSNSGDEDIEFGGGLCIIKSNINDIDYTTNFGTLTIDISGGEIYQNSAYNGTSSDDNTGCGGAFYIKNDFESDKISNCYVNVSGTTQIFGNSAEKHGAGIYLDGGFFTMTGGTIGMDGTALVPYSSPEEYKTNHNEAAQDGGGFYIIGGRCAVQGGTIAYNDADNNGGGFYVNTSSTSDTTFIMGGATIANNTAVNGGGAYVNQGLLIIQDEATNITSNTATTSGGGIYMANGTVTYTNAKMQTNTATNNDGGGLYLGNGLITVSGDDAAISGNMAKNRGGGVFVGGGNFDMSGGVIGGTTAQGNSTTANASYGGGLYMGDGIATLAGGSISGNTATEGYGGGIYMEGGTCILLGGAKIGGENATYANSARFGGGIYSAGGDITVNGGHIDYNNATVDGGGIYSNGLDATVLITKEGNDLSYMQYNTAVNGGGIYANRGSVVFTDGNVNYNYASQAGGGMYVNDEGILYLKGNAVLSRNHVPTGMKGGGVYLRGTVVVGEASKTETSILAEDNFAFTTNSPETYECNNTTRNNIYLPEPIANPYTSDIHRDVITVIENGIGAESHVGFSVPRNHVPVIYCERSDTSWDYLDRFTTGPEHDLNTRLFDDTDHYLSVHYTGWPEAFDPDHVYLYGFWPEAVRSLDDVPDDGFTVDGNTVTIRNKEGLAWLISYVNGLNGSDPHTSADLVVNLEADVDMKEFGWVPIGFRGVSGVTPKPFNGTFNGNGHLITGVNGMVYGQGENGVVDYGLFGYVTGGLVQDVFVHGMEYYTDNNGSLILGGLVGENAGGVLCNSEVQAKLISQSAETLIGGLVGKQTAGTLHSSIGVADMTGGRMGGLVAELAGGNLYNSFANSLFNSKDTNKYAGGLVAINAGTVENCYARLRGEAPSGNFGILVGNNDGEVNFCYAPAGMTNYKAAGAAPTGHGNYGDSFLPYLYCHRDTQVSLADSDNGYVPEGEDVDKQMLIALNNWVNEMSSEDMTYTKWGRPWHESNDLKPLNNDFPILKMPSADAVAAQQGDPYLYYRPIDTLLVNYTAADEAIWMYRNNGNVTGDNANSDSKLYIAEDVALINQNPLNAYVGITLDNSAGVNGANPQGGVASEGMTDATDWHIISTSLSDAPIGIDYTDGSQYAFSYGHPSGMPYFRFYPKDNDRHGYFPSHRFGTSYPESDASIEEGGANYYTEWDFYSYDEPQYHWINFKRNSASHWHIDDHSWQITYTNESKMTPGKGYFAATREETFLQCYGTLNNGSVEYNNLTQTAGVPRHGYNLIGNPYQAYLDFNAFAVANSDTQDPIAIWNTPETASYTVIDEDSQDYVTFSYDASNNPAYAGRFIYPHQGFFVLLRDRDNAAATFEPVMRNVTAESVKFRDGERPNYPLVNLYVKEASGNGDRVTIELGRPDCGGAPLMKGLRTGNGKIWCHYNDEDWAIAYTQPGITEVGIRFETAEDTEYTLRWDTQNGEFSYLHLIDNMTGANVDCLSESEYKFSSSTSDYASRFKLVFGYTGIEEDTEAEAAPTFAFMMGDEMVVNGEGVLQVFDVNGRLVMSRELHGVQSTVMLPNVANGVYMLRLTEGMQSRVQRMVISK